MQPAIIRPIGPPGRQQAVASIIPGQTSSMLSLIDKGDDARATTSTPSVASIAVLLLCSAPLFVLTVGGWANAVLFLAALLSMALLLRRDLPPAALSAADRRWVRGLVVTFVAPLVATLAAAALRHDFDTNQFDAPSRFLLAVPIFLLVLRCGASVGAFLQWVLPIALVLALAMLEIQGPDPKWDYRVTTRLVDPLVFGYLTLCFGLMCLTSILPREWRDGSRLSVVVRIAALFLGFHLSVLSGSRTGWLAVPIVLAAWLFHHWGRGHPLATVRAVLGAVAVTVATYLLVPSVSERVDLAVQEVVDYDWHGVAAETSVGQRITYLRMAAQLFAQHPLAGVGDTSRHAPAPATDFPYASQFTVHTAFHSAFHNQVVSNAVRSGIGGLLSAAALLLVPLLICLRGLRRLPRDRGKDVLMGLTYCTFVVVSSFSTEVVDLKFAASFYAVMTALFCGATLGARRGS